jgi:hypothetical protein
MNNILTTLSGALTIAGLSLLAVFESVPIVPDTLSGGGAGGVMAAFIIYRAERNGHELSARRTREIAVRWTGLGIIMSLATQGLVAIL